MKIEILYPELCNLFGDAMNAEYLRRAIPEAEFVNTTLKTRPGFLDGDVGLVYMGAMTESAQTLAADALRPFKEQLVERIDGGTAFLITGNALELFGTRIENEDGSYEDMLGVFELYARRQMMRRYSSIYLGTFGDMDIVGFKSQFAFSHDSGDGGVPAAFKTLRGAGRKPEQVEEGVRINNFIATYVLGPLLVMNPPFARYMLNLLGVEERELPYERAARAAYDARLSEFRDPRTGVVYT